MEDLHLHDELALPSSGRITVETKFGPVIGGRARNRTIHFLEIPYATLPGRWYDPEPLPQSHRYEQGKEYVRESAYCAQPTNDGQAQGVYFPDKVGLGNASENPLFLNIGLPPSGKPDKLLPVKVYIHGGFLQFGSPHGLTSQPQYVCAERDVVWVNIGYRVSVLGFLASDKPRVSGNFGFKDQWLALLWIKENIESFGGDPNDIQLTGLSAGAHSVHQILHHVSHLSPGASSPFQSAVLQSNAIMVAPRTFSELQSQFNVLCNKLDLDPTSPTIINQLRDPSIVPAQTLMDLITNEALGEWGTFRGCLDGDWLSNAVDPMEWQRSGDFARALKEKGVRSIVVGHVRDEWYLYALAHPIERFSDISINLERYFQPPIPAELMKLYPSLPDENAPKEELFSFFGEVLSDAQVHIPVRILHRDLVKAGFPVLRYEIDWSPEQHRELGKYITHGADRLIWMYRTPRLHEDQVNTVKAWLDRIDAEVAALGDAGRSEKGEQEVLVLREDKSIAWEEDKRWEQIMKLTKALPGEDSPN